MRTKFKVVMLIAMLLLSFVFVSASDAALQAVGPVDPATTFPAWYQDTTGLSLAPCFDNNGFCGITILDVPNPNLPVRFPDNIGPEGFYFIAETTAGDFFYRVAIEFAFLTEVPALADPVTFARIRHRDVTAPDGTYTFTHPYGTDTVIAAGGGVNSTVDTAAVPGVFNGALQGPIGPFLHCAGGPGCVGGFVTSLDGKVYIGNSASLVPVSGTAVTNVTVAGPKTGDAGGLFVLEGKVVGMSITPSSMDFGTIAGFPATSAPVIVTVTNIDTVNALTVASIVSSGANAANFVVNTATATPCTSVPAGGNCTFTVTFGEPAAGPQAVSAKTASIVVTAGPANQNLQAFVTPVTGIIDALPPTSTAHFPNVATIPANVAITVAFSEAMLASSITDATFTVLADGVPVAGTRTFATANNEATFIPTTTNGDLPEGALISVATTTGMTDLVGNPLSTAVTFTFTTTAADRTPPTIASTSPTSNATGIRTDAVLTVTFSEPMLGSTITADTIQVTSGGAAVSGAWTLNGAVATFTPSSALAFGTAYTLTIGTGAQDQLRNALSASQIINFVTNFQPAAPEVVSPANGATGVARPVVLRWQPSSDSDPGDVITYHLFLCNNPSFIGGLPHCIQNVTVTAAAAQAKGVYYASVGGGSMLFTLFGLGWALGFKGRKKILLMIAVLAISGLFIASCSKNDDDAPAPVSTDITHQVDGLAQNTTYFWKVEADDGKGGVTATRVMTFTTAP